MSLELCHCPNSRQSLMSIRTKPLKNATELRDHTDVRRAVPKEHCERRPIFAQSLASILGFLLAVSVGCAVPRADVALPGESVLERDQLVVYSDFYIPTQHRLIEGLTARRRDISEQLKLPTSNEPINVYVFQTENEYRQFMAKDFPEFPDRRAFFVKNDTTLKIFAFWGEQIGEDLRHEVTHGYLHSVIANLPIWLDEGLAEFYETPRGRHGFNESHVYLLSNAFRRGDWKPDLATLEQLTQPEELNQLNYAEAWLWVHFMLEGDEGDPKLIQDQLARLRMSAESEPMSGFVEKQLEGKDVKVIEHLKKLAEEL